MKLGTHILSEVLNQTISIFFGPTNQKSVLKKLFKMAKIWLLVVEQPILPLPTHTVADPYTVQIFFYGSKASESHKKGKPM